MEQAMDSLKDRFDFRVLWEPFLLRPNAPPDGTPKPATYGQPGDPGNQRLKKAGQDVGIDFTYKTRVFPNTIKSHALLEYAKDKDGGVKQDEVQEKLFMRYFTIGDELKEASLLEVAAEVGFDQADVKQYIGDSNVLERVKNKAISWSQRGISGVPTFYMNGQEVCSGAQDSATFKKLFETVAEKFPLHASNST